MRVGAQPPRAPGSAFLLLGLALGAAAQLSCVGDTYPSGSRCCKECQPGYGMESRCTHARDTVCRPCEPGFYNEAVNYEACKPCTQCNQHCAPCPPGHFSLGNDQACQPWTNCTSLGKRTLRAASNSSDAVCEDRSPRLTPAWETQGPAARSTPAQPTTTWPRASQGPSTPHAEPPKGPELAAVLGLGLGLGLLAPVAAALALLLHHRAWRLTPNAPKPPGANSFRTPIQEEHADANSSLAKI
ncbi:tumor necrosis factor receptor superfamily member 4 isoform X2 [Eubalaena glacialis]|uniref:tumor necrosis factor receptor superfamily member 4 isoform X2 n=1 Tax=Eubalaena glacialis TaxID=27606 RepID=UPI002A59F558|nr:tumor necrosis factor receptor superfamily member 4 isoform X2 [Eubalaena glacialis]